MFLFHTTPGGPTPSSCSGGIDLFGSLYSAWNAGLWEFLSSNGTDSEVVKQGREGISDGPGIVANPSKLLIREKPSDIAVEAIKVKLSGPPEEGESLLRQFHYFRSWECSKLLR